MKQSLTFDGVAFDVVTHNNQPCLTLGEIAVALYGKGGDQSDAPSESHIRQLQKLYQRHADEFTESMTALVKLRTPGGTQDVRVFSLRGTHLLGMFARTERAKKFRKWVLDILDEHLAGSRSLTSQFHAALAEYTSKKAVASLCGRGLNQWKGDKPPLEERMHMLSEQMQGNLLLN
jgi:prophage antirepressor-like protein